MLNTIIVEDEPRAMSLLLKYLAKYCPTVNIIGTATDANEAYEIINIHKPQLLFLDIEISNDESPETSFDLLARLPKYHYEVIFVTAFNHYALQAIKFHALDYLLKPIDIDELEKAVKLAEQKLLSPVSNPQLLDLINHLQNPKQKNKRIWIPMSDGLQAVDINDILYIEASGRYSYLHLNSASKILSTRNLKIYISLLEEHPQFAQIHRSYLINTNYISKYISTDGGFVQMSNQTELPISRRKKQDFLDMLNNL